MRNDKDLLAVALKAYTIGDGEAKNTHIWPSAAWFAHEIGRAMGGKGLTPPAQVAMSRGYEIRAETASGALFRLACSGDDLERRVFERV